MIIDPDSMFTLTGVIATILSVFFAIAAFIVRLRGKRHAAAGKVVEATTKTVLEAHEVPRLPPPEQILAQQEADQYLPPPQPVREPAKSTIPEPPPREVSAEESLTTPSNYFKKYSSSRETEEVVPSDEKEAYAWD